MPVVSVVAQGTFQRTTPYITTDMFKNHARAAVQVENLVPKGSPAQQDAALAMVIEEACGWIDIEAEQTFASVLNTVACQVNVNRNGYVVLNPPSLPVAGLTAFSIGPNPSQLSALASLAGCFVQRNQIQVPVYPLATLTSSQGPIQFGGVAAPSMDAFVSYTYVNDYPVTYLTADTAAGAAFISVADTTGIVAGKTWLTVYALENRFRFLAGAVSTADAGGIGTGPGTVACSVPRAISNSADYPVMVSALPSDLIAASVLVTRGFLKQKAGGSVSATTATSRDTGRKKQAGDDFEEAWKIIEKHLNPVGDNQ